MTAAFSDLHPPPGGWTTDDLDNEIEINEPWPIRMPVSTITPRFYRPDA